MRRPPRCYSALRGHHKRGTAPVLAVCGDFVLAHTVSHSESFDGQSAIVCVRELVCREGGAGCSCLLTPRAPGQCLHFECRGAPARVRVWRCEGRPPLPHHLCVWRSLPYLTLPVWLEREKCFRFFPLIKGRLRTRTRRTFRDRCARESAKSMHALRIAES